MTHIAIIDADSMIYELSCVSKDHKKNQKNLVSKIESVIQSVEADTAYVFIKGKDNFRYQCTDDYKANRKDNLSDEQKETLKELYAYAATFCVQSDGGEADDFCGITAKDAALNGDTFTISHIDKDLNGLVGWHHNFRKNEVYQTTPEESYRFMFKQFLTGDMADNIRGLWKVGPVGANKILDPVPVEKLWDATVATWSIKQPGDWKKEFVRCVNCIYIRDRLEDLRPMTFEELKERLTWKTTSSTDTGSVTHPESQIILLSSTSSHTSTPGGDTWEESSLLLTQA
jgi:5'-3' exonuclease